MSNGWPAALHARQAGTSCPTRRIELPRPSAGVLVLEESHQLLCTLPGGVLSHVDAPVHYLDLGGLQARSLADFGSSAGLLAGVTKLYACHAGLSSLDGLQHLRRVRWLYLDHNALEESELLSLPDVLPPGTRLQALDIRGNPGCTACVEAALEASPLLAAAEFFNGRRLRRL